METFKTLLDLFFTFAKIGAVTFGGGIAMLPILEHELADKRHWTTGEELLDYYAISQSTPGVIAVNVSTFIGYKRKGVAGGIVATAGVVTPSIIIITIIALCLSNFADIPVVQKALVGINVAVAALLTYAVVNFVKKTLRGVFAGIMLVAGFAAIYFFKVSTVWVILGSAVIGILFSALRGDLKKDGGTK
jgi:chromate transporter